MDLSKEFRMRYEDPHAVALAWQDAANNGDIDLLLELSDPDIEVVGPRGSGYGHQLLRDWLARAGLSLETLRVFAGGNTVVVAQHGVWRSADTGGVIGERSVASRFQVEGQRVARVQRYDSLDIALDEASIGYSDEVPRDHQVSL